MHVGDVRWARPLPAAGDPVDELRAENRALRERLDAYEKSGPSVLFQVEDNVVHLRNLEVAGMHVERLKAGLDDSTDLIGGLTLQGLMATPGKLTLPSLDALGENPIVIQELKVRVPAAALNEAAALRGREVLAEEGIRDLKLSYLPDGGIQAEGVMDKLISVPFKVQGRLELTRDQKIRFSPDKVRVFGVLPVPRLISSIATALAGDSLEKMDVRQEGADLVFNPAGFLPRNVKIHLTSMRTEGDELVLEAGPPPRPSANPRTLWMED